MFLLHAFNLTTSILLAVLQSAVSTAHVRRQVIEPEPDVPFIITSGSGSVDGPVALKPVNANNKTYWIGKPTATLALVFTNQTQNLTVDTDTVLQHHGASLVNNIFPITALPLTSFAHCPLMMVELTHHQWTSGPFSPQLNYIASTGALSFMTPSCRQTLPHGYIHGHFTASIFPIREYHGWHGRLSFVPDRPVILEPREVGLDWLACPSGGDGQWQILAALKGLKDTDVPGGHVKDCLGISLITSYPGTRDPYAAPVDAVAAYQYA